MENRINLVEILKDCPAGTPLYSLIHGEVEFCNIVTGSGFPIAVVTKRNCYPSFTSDGRYLGDGLDGECILFPSKENRDWSKFQRPFKDGDIITCTNSCCTFTSIFKERTIEKSFIRYCTFILEDNEFKVGICLSDFCNPRFATEVEKQKLFKAIKEHGYKWNAETKTLEKLIEPKFKVGDKIQHKNGYSLDVSILKINADCYTVKDFMGDQITIDFTHQDNYELVPDKFDLNTLKPFKSSVLKKEIEML